MTAYTSGLDVNMEEYILTQEDIDALSEGGIDMRGVAAGVGANQAEMEFLGTPTSSVADDTMSALIATMPPPTVINSQADAIAATLSPEELASLRVPTGVPAPEMPPVTASNVDQVLGTGARFVASSPSGQAPSLQSLGMMAPRPASNDPYENLSKTQRRMLAFSALSDAGAALAGRDTDSYGRLMGQYNDFSDMNRKREAALAQQQILSRLMGGSGVPADAVGGTGVDALNARKQQLLQFAMVSPASAGAIALQVKSIDDQIAKLQQGEKSLISTNMGIAAVDALINSPDLNKITGISGRGNEWLSSLGLAPEYSTLMSYVEQLKGLNFLEAFQSLKGSGPVTDAEGAKATAARSRIDRALQGTPADLVAALEDVRVLFAQARASNPAYKGTGEQPADSTVRDNETEEDFKKRMGL